MLSESVTSSAASPRPGDFRFSLAPMMDWSDRHCRMFWRRLTRRARLYTEMLTSSALLHGDSFRLLRFEAEEQPLALQVGGSEPAPLAACARLAERHGFVEINLNCGCPSDRVQQGRFGACLMAEPALVADCVRAMCDACTLPVTVKHRLGIDHQDSEQALVDFVGTLADAGCEVFFVHARKAWLQGLSAKENREIPPLDYDRVYRLKQQFPDRSIILNGGITDLSACERHLARVDGVMLGREPYRNPWLLAAVDPLLFGTPAPAQDRIQALRALYPYIEAELAAGTRLQHLTRHLLGLFQGQPGGRAFRRHLSTHAHRPDATLQVLEQAVALIEHQQRPPAAASLSVTAQSC